MSQKPPTVSSSSSSSSSPKNRKLIFNILYKTIFTPAPQTSYYLCSASDLSEFSYFTRRTIAENIRFATRTIVERATPNLRSSVVIQNELPFVCHTFIRSDGLSGVVVAHKDYPPRIAFSLLYKTMQDYETKNGDKWKKVTKDMEQTTEPMYMCTDLAKYQNVTEVDKISKINQSLDDVKEIMKQNIEDVLRRGESIDILITKSKDLSLTSAEFYKKAKKTNQCCKAY